MNISEVILKAYGLKKYKNAPKVRKLLGAYQLPIGIKCMTDCPELCPKCIQIAMEESVKNHGISGGSYGAKTGDSLCWCCGNSTGGCVWSSSCGEIPVKGAEMVETKSGTRVVKCPQFYRG